MRLFAEERKLGTLELLWTYPVRDAEIIAGKFVACLAVVTLMLGATATYPLIVARFHAVDAGPLLAGYLGLWLLAAAFVACGLAVSALTDSQLVAGAATYGVLLFFWVLTWNEAAVNEVTRGLLLPLSLFDRFYAFARGAVDSRDVVYLLLFSATCLVLTGLALDTRRWRGVR
jgi:ABC-2 type transport system permease protein